MKQNQKGNIKIEHLRESKIHIAQLIGVEEIDQKSFGNLDIRYVFDSHININQYL